MITLHGRKPAREPFAFLTCSLISHFWAGDAVIFFGFLETLLCIRTFALNRTIGRTIRDNTLSQGQLLYVPSFATHCLRQHTRFGFIGRRTIRKKRGCYMEDFQYTREQTLTRINHRPLLTTQAPSSTQLTFRHGQLQRKAYMHDR